LKLFGKKTLALFLALAMVMPMCVFAETPPAPTVVSAALEKPENAEIEVAYGITDPGMKDVKLVLTYSDSTTKTVAPTWKAEPKYDGTKLGTYTYTASVSGVTDVELPTVTVEVVPAVITGITYSPADPMLVPLGATSRMVKRALPEAAAVKLADGRTLEWTVGDGKNDELVGWDGNFNEDETDAANYDFTTELNEKLVGYFTVSATEDLTYTVKALDSIDADIALTLKYKGDEEEEFDLADLVAEELEDLFSTFDITLESLELEELTGTYGEVDKDGNYALDLSSTNVKLLENGSTLVEKKIDYTAEDENGVEYEGEVTVSIISAVKNFNYEMEDDEFSFEFGAWFAEKLTAAMKEAPVYAVFEIEEDEGGVLYADDEQTKLEEGEKYYLSADDDDEEYALEDLLFLPDGTEAEYQVSYVAYGEDEEELEGVITIECQEFLLLTADIDSTDVVEFEASDIEDLIEKTDYDDYALEYITGLKVTGGGTLYYDYDEDDKTHSKVKSSTKYYVDDEEDDLIDEITYVPGKKTNGQVIISFDVHVEKGSKKEDLPATFLINVTERADITMEVGKGETASFDLEWFEDIVKENATSTKKNHEIAYIVFEDAPKSKAAGYLYADGKKLTNPDGKKFYTEDDDDGDYDFDELTFVGGTAVKTTRATFSVYGRKSGSTSKPTVLISDYTIDFVVGSAHTLNGTTKASQTMSLYQSLDAFVALGDNKNVYVEFTSLPVGGKLYYNYGTATQEDVTIGTDYYLSTAVGKKQLRYVTFVPSYSSSQIAKTASFGVKGYNDKNKAVTGTVNIAITYANTSAYFTDVKTAKYADSVDFLYNRGITTGMTSTTFGPDSNVTRGQFVTFLYRAAGQPVVTTANTFTDVKTTDYYYNAVRWAVQNGITNGRSATVFDPNANVTYQEIMTFLYRYDVTYLKHASGSGSTSYVYDYSKVDTWAQTPVKWAVHKGILDAGYLNPTTAGTRANVALYMHRMLTL